MLYTEVACTEDGTQTLSTLQAPGTQTVTAIRLFAMTDEIDNRISRDQSGQESEREDLEDIEVKYN